MCDTCHPSLTFVNAYTQPIELIIDDNPPITLQPSEQNESSLTFTTPTIQRDAIAGPYTTTFKYRCLSQDFVETEHSIQTTGLIHKFRIFVDETITNKCPSTVATFLAIDAPDPSPVNPPSPKTNDDQLNTASIAGIVTGTIILLAIIAVIIYFVVSKNR